MDLAITKKVLSLIQQQKPELTMMDYVTWCVMEKTKHMMLEIERLNPSQFQPVENEQTAALREETEKIISEANQEAYIDAPAGDEDELPPLPAA